MRTEISKPYPNYHSARIKSPGAFAWIKVLRTTKEGIMIYGGALRNDPKGSTQTQAVRFPKKKFTVSEAKAWLKEHDFKYVSFEAAVEKSLGTLICERLCQR